MLSVGRKSRHVQAVNNRDDKVMEVVVYKEGYMVDGRRGSGMLPGGFYYIYTSPDTLTQ